MTTILTKKKDTTGAPAPGDLTNAAGGAELAVNTFDKRLYTKDAGGNVVEIGTNPSTIDTTTVDTTNLEVTNIKAKDGTASATIANSTGVMTIASSVLTTTDINGGTIDGTAIGGSTAAAGAFTTLTSNGATTFTANTASTSTTTGTAVITGGLGVSGRINAANFDGIVGANTAAAGSFTTLSASGVATFSAGTVSAPAITTTGDTNTGIFFPAADTIAFAEGGVEAMRIDSSGNVGIGTSSPTALLDVNGNLAITGSARRITGDFSNATAANRVLFQSSTTNGFTAVSVIPNGTSTSSFLQTINNSDPANASTMQLAVSAAESQISASRTGTGTYLPLTMYTGGSERLRIDTSGNVGIGTSSPSQKLDVRGAIAATDGGTQTTYISNAGEIELARTAGDAYIDFSTSTAEDFDCRIQQVSNGLRFLTGGNGSSSERMRIDSSGNVGIGVTNPLAKLDVLNTAYISTTGTNTASLDIGIGRTGNGFAFLDLVGDTTYSDYGLRIIRENGGANTTSAINHRGTGALLLNVIEAGTIQFNTSSAERMRITSGGDLLVGTTTAGAGTGVNFKLAVDAGSIDGGVFKVSGGAGFAPLVAWNTVTTGNNIFTSFVTEGGGGTQRGTIDYNRAGGQVRYNTTSDQRLKENIVDAPSSLNTINNIQIRSFDWKETGNHVEHGVIAQELHDVFPDAVSVGTSKEDGSMDKPWGVDTSTIVPALIKAVQELSAKVEAQAAEIALLKSK